MNEQTIRINEDGTLTVGLSNGDKYTLREPLAKDMARITTPPLTRLQYGKLSLSDAQVLNTALDFFSAPPKAKAEMREALQELGYLAASESEQTTSAQ